MYTDICQGNLCNTFKLEMMQGRNGNTNYDLSTWWTTSQLLKFTFMETLLSLEKTLMLECSWKILGHKIVYLASSQLACRLTPGPSL